MHRMYLDENILDKNDIKEYLKENLKMDFSINCRESTLNIELSLGKETILSDYVDLEWLNPSRDISTIIKEILNIVSKIPFVDEESKETTEKLNRLVEDIEITPLELIHTIWGETYSILKEYLLDENGFIYDNRLDYGVIILSQFLNVNKNTIKGRFKRKKGRKVV